MSRVIDITDEDAHGHVYDIMPVCETCSLGTDLLNLKIENGRPICMKCGKPMIVLLEYVCDSNFQEIPPIEGESEEESE